MSDVPGVRGWVTVAPGAQVSQDCSVLTGIPALSERRSSPPGDQRQTHWDWEITTTAGAHALPPPFVH